MWARDSLYQDHKTQNWTGQRNYHKSLQETIYQPSDQGSAICPICLINSCIHELMKIEVSESFVASWLHGSWGTTKLLERGLLSAYGRCPLKEVRP